MFNKLVKGFVIGTALIGSLTMVGCESTMTDDELAQLEYETYGMAAAEDDTHVSEYTKHAEVEKQLEEIGEFQNEMANEIPEIEEVEEITKEQAYEIILSEATRLYGNVEVNASDIGYNGITYYANVINPEDREIIASIKVDCITGEVVEVVE